MIMLYKWDDLVLSKEFVLQIIAKISDTQHLTHTHTNTRNLTKMKNKVECSCTINAINCKQIQS
jgi:hypothetical protein